MRRYRWHILGILILGLIFGAVFFKPIKFYTIKYGNRFLSANTTPVEKREKETVETYDWSLIQHGGENTTFGEFKGEVVLVNFWATWCPPCIEEMPSLNDLYQAYGDKVTFLFIARDKENRVSRFLTKKGYDLPVYYENGITPKLLYNPSIPTTYIVSKTGVIEMAKNGVYDWNSQEVRELLDNLLTE